MRIPRGQPIILWCMIEERLELVTSTTIEIKQLHKSHLLWFHHKTRHLILNTWRSLTLTKRRMKSTVSFAGHMCRPQMKAKFLKKYLIDITRASTNLATLNTSPATKQIEEATLKTSSPLKNTLASLTWNSIFEQKLAYAIQCKHLHIPINRTSTKNIFVYICK